MNPILKAQQESEEEFEKAIKNAKPRWCGCEGYPGCSSCKAVGVNDVIKSFLTTYAESILNAALEAGPEKKPVFEHQKFNRMGVEKFRGFNDCRSSFHSAINEGIKEIRKN